MTIMNRSCNYSLFWYLNQILPNMPFLNMLLAVAAFPNLATAWTVGQEVDTTSGRVWTGLEP